jgi:hypothetical protein
MALNVFLLLPGKEDAVLDIIKDENAYKQFVKEVSEIVSALPKDNSVKLFYDADNIQTFLNICENFDSELYLSHAKYQIQNFISAKSANIQDKLSKAKDCVYILWNYEKLLNVAYSPDILSEIAEKILSFPNETYLVLNVSENIKADRNVLLVCKDAKHISDLPKFARVPFVTDKTDLELWWQTNHVSEFSLLDRNRFSKTKKIVQGQSIYLEIATNHYWYFDNLHKDHYEVFDIIGKHIGEADLQGKIDTSKKDKTKQITI